MRGSQGRKYSIWNVIVVVVVIVVSPTLVSRADFVYNVQCALFGRQYVPMEDPIYALGCGSLTNGLLEVSICYPKSKAVG